MSIDTAALKRRLEAAAKGDVVNWMQICRDAIPAIDALDASAATIREQAGEIERLDALLNAQTEEKVSAWSRADPAQTDNARMTAENAALQESFDRVSDGHRRQQDAIAALRERLDKLNSGLAAAHKACTKHGGARHGKEERLYRVWRGMIKRCENANVTCYPRYGGRGICVCDEWRDYAKFRSWAHENGYVDRLQIDRINNDGNYDPTNCRFVTQLENVQNQSTTVKLTVNGYTACASEWGRRIGAAHDVVANWVRKYGREEAVLRIERALNEMPDTADRLLAAQLGDERGRME